MSRPIFAFGFILLSASCVNLANGAIISGTYIGDAGANGGTTVYRFNLGAELNVNLGISSLSSLKLTETSGSGSSSTGSFSGFDLDGLRLSYTSTGVANEVDGLAPAGGGVLDFTPAYTTFTPGFIVDAGSSPYIAPTAGFPNHLWGSTAGGEVDPSATLGSIDAWSTLDPNVATGFMSMGEGGMLQFDFTSTLSTAGLFLYIGEVGENGELATLEFTVNPTSPSTIPEPTAAAIWGLFSLLGACILRRKKVRSV